MQLRENKPGQAVRDEMSLEDFSKLTNDFIEVYFEDSEEDRDLKTLWTKKIEDQKGIIVKYLENSEKLDLVFPILENLIYVHEYRIWASELIEKNLNILEEEMKTSNENLF